MPVADPLQIARAVTTLREFWYGPGRSLDDRQAQALAVIYRGYSGMLLAVARRISPTDSDAEDVVHDVFTRLPRILHQYRGGGLGGWLRRVTQRAALMQIRKVRRLGERSLGTDATHELEGDCPANLGSADSLHDALAELAEPLRQVVVLRVYLDYSHREIAEALDISPTASEVRLCRAIKRLRAGMRNTGASQLRRSA